MDKYGLSAHFQTFLKGLCNCLCFILLGGFLPCLGRFWGFGPFGNLYGTLKAVKKFFFRQV